jgi:putative nucleotidyltransferase with HDIG domain
MTLWTLDRLLEHANAIPTMPAVVAEILEHLQDESASAERLASALNHDPAVVARLLQAANSGAFAATGPINSIQKALVVLGLKRVRTITLAVSALGVMQKAPPPFSVPELRLHSVGVAVCARTLARMVHTDPDQAYISGLLHDLGRLLLANLLPKAYGEILQRCGKEKRYATDLEMEILGVDHAQVSGGLARRWGLPAAVCEAMENHHHPGDNKLAQLIHLADVVSHALDLGAPPQNLLPQLGEDALNALGLTMDDLSAHFGEIESRFQSHRLALGL